MRIGIISHSQKESDRPERFVSKNAAGALVRRLLAVRIRKDLIQMVQLRHTSQARPAKAQRRKLAPKAYEHRLEPRLELLTMGGSDWIAYLQGYIGSEFHALSE
jgi:hypothetical protein